MKIFEKRLIMKKISIVSGGSEGLGLALAESLLRSGKDILILGRSCEKLNSAAKKLGRISAKAHISKLVCNIGSPWPRQGVADKERDITEFMNTSDVTEKVVNSVLNADKLTVTDITINRKK
jgi:short-subunit dehydrogenase